MKNPDGTTRIIHQTISAPTPKTAAQGGVSSDASSTQTPSAPAQHKVQIIRGPDGKVSVRGLNPGQQLIQMPDGKLHVLTTTPGKFVLMKKISSVCFPIKHFKNYTTNLMYLQELQIKLLL